VILALKGGMKNDGYFINATCYKFVRPGIPKSSKPEALLKWIEPFEDLNY
jgi:hypothetical protein